MPRRLFSSLDLNSSCTSSWPLPNPSLLQSLGFVVFCFVTEFCCVVQDDLNPLCSPGNSPASPSKHSDYRRGALCLVFFLRFILFVYMYHCKVITLTVFKEFVSTLCSHHSPPFLERFNLYFKLGLYLISSLHSSST